jgi:regulator of sigma E protease
MNEFISTILFVLSLGLLVFIHELGHFVAAKAFGVYVKEFSLGFGPKLLSFKRGETTYCIKAFPLGGYVAMFGEEVSLEGIDVPRSRSLLGISKPKRAVIMSAGVILNFILAFVLFFLSNWGFTQQQLTNQLVVDPTSILGQAGIQTGEVLDFTTLSEQDDVVTTSDTSRVYRLRINNPQSYTTTLDDLLEVGFIDLANQWVRFIPSSSNDFIDVSLPIQTLTSSNTLTSRDVLIRWTAISTESGYAWRDLGTSFYVFTTDYDFLGALDASWTDWTQGVGLIFNTILGLFSGTNLDQVGGIVAIFATSSSVLQNLGLGTYIFLWALISVNLAMFNLLPFPGLDGWHLLVITLEGLFRKEIPSTIKNVLSLIGFFILMTLMVVLIFRDLGLFIALFV